MSCLKRKRVIATAIQYLYILRNDGWRIAETFYWPSLGITVWGYVSTWTNQGTGGLFNFLGPIILWEATAQGIIAIAINMIDELNASSIVSLFSTPLSIREWALASVPTSLLTSCLVATYCSLLAWLLFGYNPLSMGWPLLPIAINLFGFGVAIGLACTALLLRVGLRIKSLMYMLSWCLFPLAGAFYPVDMLPQWLQAITHCLPLCHLFDIVRAQNMAMYIAIYKLGVATALTTLYLAFSFCLLAYAFRKTLNHGLARLTY